MDECLRVEKVMVSLYDGKPTSILKPALDQLIIGTQERCGSGFRNAT